jgi:hypothetical protein
MDSSSFLGGFKFSSLSNLLSSAIALAKKAMMDFVCDTAKSLKNKATSYVKAEVNGVLGNSTNGILKIDSNYNFKVASSQKIINNSRLNDLSSHVLGE